MVKKGQNCVHVVLNAHIEGRHITITAATGTTGAAAGVMLCFANPVKTIDLIDHLFMSQPAKACLRASSAR